MSESWRAILWSLLGSDRCMTMHWLGWSREAINSSVMIILLTWDKDGMRIGLSGESKTYQRVDCGRVELEKVGQYRLGVKVKDVMKCESQGRV